MIRTQFNNQKSFQTVDFVLISEESVMLSGKKLKANDSGFKAYRLNGDFLGDYSEYTKCTEAGEGFIFSKP